MYEDGHRQATMRAYALGGVLQILRAGKGWSVEQAAVHAGLGHMTWRRMEDGFSVRNKTYAAVDSLFELPFGTTKRALADDALMLGLIGRVAADVPVNPTPERAAEFVAQFARQTLSKAGKQTVQARESAMPSLTEGPLARAADIRGRSTGATFAAHGTLGPAVPAPVSDVEAVAQVLDRISRRHLTPRLEAAVRALLDAMPDLLSHPDGSAEAAIQADEDAVQR